MDQKYTFFQYRRELELPLYFRVELSKFHKELTTFLEVQGLNELKEDEAASVQKSMEKYLSGRIITLRPASPGVARQIETAQETDRYGEESIIPKTGYRVYRYKGSALAVYSFAATEWEVGVYENFGSKDTLLSSRVVVNRLLTWALANYGVVGFWGTFEKQTLSVMRKDQSQGEVVYINLKTDSVYTKNGMAQLNGHFKLLKPNPTANRQVRISSESLAAYLSSQTSFLDHQGLSVPVRQLIQSISKRYQAFEGPLLAEEDKAEVPAKKSTDLSA